MSEMFRLEGAKGDASVDLLTGLRAAQASGKSMASLVTEIVRLVRGPGRLTPQEYFAYRLYDDGRFTSEEKRRFLGKRAQDRIFAECTDLRWWMAAHDKLLFASAMRGAGLPVPRTVAVYHAVRRDDGARPLRSGADLRRFLREDDPYPVFGKPIDGMHSVASAALDAYDREADAVVSATGARCPVDVFVDDVARLAEGGYLFQERLRPHEAIEEACGRRLATVRIVVVVTDTELEIARCLWKLPAGENVSDNFWRPGNLLATVDRESGRVERVVRGTGPSRETLEEHPDTGVPLVGFVLPAWREVLDLVREGSVVLGGLALQAWDVAVTDLGPVLVEANVGGDVDLPQIADDRGLLDERFAGMLQSLGYEG